MLAVVLIALAFGAQLAARLGARQRLVGWILVLGGIGVVLATPVVERFDTLTATHGTHLAHYLYCLGWSVLVIGPPVTLLGVALPWLLSRNDKPGVMVTSLHD